MDMNYQKFSQIELMALLHDLSLNDIGIGIENCFTITYSFLGVVSQFLNKYVTPSKLWKVIFIKIRPWYFLQVLGMVISYTLIFYQLQNTPTCVCTAVTN